MILIENADRTQRNIFLDMNVDLMWENTVVATMLFQLGRYGIWINSADIFNKDLLPLPMTFGKSGLVDWFINRGFLRKSHRNIYFAEQALREENRDMVLPVILSLQMNSVSICDKYWLNPHQNYDFFINSAHILFKKTTWDEVNPFANTYSPCEIDNIALYDLFHFPIHAPFTSNSLIWTTHGDKNKRWVVKDGQFYLEKKLSSSALSNEMRTFKFFSERGILVPQFEFLSRKELLEDEQQIYNISTHYDGLHIITKKCLVDNNSYFIPACYFVDKEQNITELIKKMCYMHSVKWWKVRRFISAITAFKKEFHTEDNLINTTNFGLIVRPSDAEPVVVGRLNLVYDPFFGIRDEIAQQR